MKEIHKIYEIIPILKEKGAPLFALENTWIRTVKCEEEPSKVGLFDVFIYKDLFCILDTFAPIPKHLYDIKTNHLDYKAKFKDFLIVQDEPYYHKTSRYIDILLEPTSDTYLSTITYDVDNNNFEILLIYEKGTEDYNNLLLSCNLKMINL